MPCVFPVTVSSSSPLHLSLASPPRSAAVIATSRDEVGVLARTLDETAARLQQLVERERALLSDVSHELRTLIARMRLAIELCEDEASPDADQHLRGRHDLLVGFADDVAELEQLVDDVLTASRLDAVAAMRTPQLQRAPVDTAHLVAVLADRFADRHPAHALEVEAADELPMLFADEALLRRLVDNLLDNAARYAEASAGPVGLVARRDGDGIAIDVRDRGEGVASEDLPRLFEPFFRADQSRARGTGGHGLGLSICRRIARAHGGEVNAGLQAGGGMVFTVTLPPG